MTPPYSIVHSKILDYLSRVEDQTFHASCTSIPYWKQRKYVKGAYGQERTREEWGDNQVAVYEQVKRTLRDDGTACVVVGECMTTKKSDNVLKRGEVSLQGPYLAERFRQAGWWVKALIILEFTNKPPVPFYNRPVQSHEYAILLAKNENAYYYDYITSRDSGVDFERMMRTVWSGRTEKAWVSKSGFKHSSIYPRWIPDRYLSAAVSEAGVCGACGAPRMPIIKDSKGGSKGKSWHAHDNDAVNGNAKTASSKDYEPAIITGWKKGCRCRVSPDAPPLVFDPYTGTSTTGVVAMSRGCAYIGVDMDRRCITASNERLAEHAKTLEMPLFDSRKASRRQISLLPAETEE